MGQEKKKTLLDRAIDAVTNRDEKQAAEEATAKAAQEAAQRAEAEARAKAAEQRAREAEQRAQKIEQERAAEARIKAAQKAAEERFAAQRAAKEAEELAAKAAEEAAQPRIYVVKPGDSLSKIAKAELGNANRYPEIVELNRDKIKDPNLIYPGQEFVLPKE